MVTVKMYNHQTPPTAADKKAIVSFLFEHLDQYGDPAGDIEKCMNYALKENNAPGGLILTASDEDKLAGVVIVNKTGMDGYIPENILVYIATHREYRGKGIGKALMNNAIEHAEGDIALHVEPDNPAKKLYESLGFTNKYLEMRFKKGGN